MKKLVYILLLLMISFASASIEISNFTIKEEYSPYEVISGEINVIIIDENLDSILKTKENVSVVMKDFLTNNSANYNCTPPDCLNNYDAKEGTTEKVIYMSDDTEKYFGFSVSGENLQILGISFNITSDFGKEDKVPLKMQFFDSNLIWEFTEPSGEFSSYIYRGCYNSSESQTNYDLGATPYCERYTLPRTASLRMGAGISGTDDKKVTMILYDKYKSEKGKCTYLPGNESNCIINISIQEGDYFACVKADVSTNYRISSENSGENCGWFGLPSSENSSTDYNIFAITGRYNTIGNVKIDDASILSLVSGANLFIQNKYKKQCTNGCTIPIKISGVTQNLKISAVTIRYSSGAGGLTDDKAYNVDKAPSKFYFSGILDLSETGFDVGAKGKKNFTLYFNDNSILSKDIEVLAAPTIIGITPSNPPAGVPVTFTAYLEDGLNVTSYLWNFGDGKTAYSTGSSVVHLYENVSAYTLILNVTDINNRTTSKSFTIVAGSPRNVINLTLDYKKGNLNNISREINTFPPWYQDQLSELINETLYQEEIARLEKERDNAITDEELLKVADKIWDLNIPKAVIIGESSSFPLTTELETIDPEPVVLIAGGKIENVDAYKNAILQWQLENIQAIVSNQKIVTINDHDERETILNVYSVSATSNSDIESYFVILKSRDELYFKNEDNTIKKEGDATVVVLNPNEQKDFEFYYKTQEEVAMFVSPKLSYLPVEATIEPCNYNFACEKDLGENSNNCRNDCKPVGKMIFYLVLVVLAGLLIYTALQMWYKSRYEKYLFKDPRQLYNLVMFITNARVRGMKDDEIEKELKKKGWNNEQIKYAMKKSRGEKTGLYEIIPVEKLFAYLRERKVRQNINKQQPQRNINGPKNY